MTRGRKNVYSCNSCGGVMVTVDADEGVTPFMTYCTATRGCPGPMTSAFYRVEGDPDPTHEWYRPASLRGLKLHVVDHVSRGGLVLRERRDEEARDG